MPFNESSEPTSNSHFRAHRQTTVSSQTSSESTSSPLFSAHWPTAGPPGSSAGSKCIFPPGYKLHKVISGGVLGVKERVKSGKNPDREKPPKKNRSAVTANGRGQAAAAAAPGGLSRNQKRNLARARKAEYLKGVIRE